MLKMDCVSPYIKLHEDRPDFRLVKSIPSGLAPQIEEAVKDFIKTSHVPEGIDLNGFYYQTLQAIANATILSGAGEFWIGTVDNELVIYTIAYINNDFDGKLAYHISQTWVKKEYRGKPIVKEWWNQIKQRAKDCFCGHLCLTSSRNPKAYERWLGDGMKHYATLLKQTL